MIAAICLIIFGLIVIVPLRKYMQKKDAELEDTIENIGNFDDVVNKHFSEEELKNKDD